MLHLTSLNIPTMTIPQVVVLVTFLIFLPSTHCKKCGFNWQPYNGIVPDDAFQGGKDGDGNPFYIGLVNVYATGDTVPGMIKPSTKIAYITVRNLAMKAQTGSKYEVKILCTKDKDGFKWFPTTSTSLHMITNTSLVPGGYAFPKALYIGRVCHNGNYAVGKVFPNYDPGVPWVHLEGLYVPSWFFYAHYYSFEVLTYKCSDDVGLGKTEKPESVDEAIELIFAKV